MNMNMKMKCINNIFLTGHPSVGKTTIIKKIEQHIRTQTEIAISISGFYTEECRNGTGNRIGFDIVHKRDVSEKGETNEKSDWERVPLSRMVPKVRKSDPAVGKYLVNIDNIEEYAVGSISLDGFGLNLHKGDDENVHAGLILLDEVGKMEMLCPSFLPAVTKLLDRAAISSAATSQTGNHPISVASVVLGTIPTPRYGRVIQAVETIRARDDVMVLHVTKDNREVLPDLIYRFVDHQIKMQLKRLCAGDDGKDGNDHEDEYISIMQELETFRYSRPIGASSMNGKGKETSTTSKKETAKSINATSNHQIAGVSGSDECENSQSTPMPCGPLLHDNVLPTILLLGETASPQPSQRYAHLAYCERSMWRVLGFMMKDVIDYQPIKNTTNLDQASEESIQLYSNLRAQVLKSGICVWDVLSDVHVKKSGGGKGGRGSSRSKRKRSTDQQQHPNDIAAFLKHHPSIQIICFIGKKARTTFDKSSLSEDMKLLQQEGRPKLEYETLPSSSPANARMTIEEKAIAWREAIEAHLLP